MNVNQTGMKQSILCETCDDDNESVGNKKKKPGLFRNLFFLSQGEYCVKLYRKREKIKNSSLPQPIRYFLIRRYSTKMARLFGCYLSEKASIDMGLKLPHPSGIVIGANVTIGNNCRIYQQVTIGGKNQGDSASGHMPQIGNNVILYAGSKVLGNVKVADYTILGANAVLTCDTVPGGVYAGIPAKLIEIRNNS